MKLQFAHDAFSEYSQGNLNFHRDDQPFDVIGDTAAVMLQAKAEVPGEGMVNVFEPAAPEDGPAHVEMTEASLAKLKKDQLLEMAAELDAGATEDNNKAEIIEKILATTQEN